MKLEIKYKVTNPQCAPFINEKGDWFDLVVAKNTTFPAPYLDSNNKVQFRQMLIDLGIAMSLPKGIEAIIAPRSSTFYQKGLLQTNSIGVIDSTYSGNDDIWKFPAIAFKATIIAEGDRVCQFRLQPSQRASIWTKIKWLFVTDIKFVKTDKLDKPNRGGFGSTKGYK